MALAYVSRIMNRRDSLSRALHRWHKDASLLRLALRMAEHPNWPLIESGRVDPKPAPTGGGHQPRGAA